MLLSVLEIVSFNSFTLFCVSTLNFRLISLTLLVDIFPNLNHTSRIIAFLSHSFGIRFSPVHLRRITT